MTDYATLTRQAEALLEAEPWAIAAFSNLSALLMQTMPDLNWAGFYLVRHGGLTVGPFQGKPACIHIPFGKGVCGTAAAEDRTQLVPDVHQFPGHIACDYASASEMVIPVHRDGQIAAVLDLDSPLPNRFDEADRLGLETLIRRIEKRLEWA